MITPAITGNPTAFYGSRSIKRQRRTRAELDRLREGLYNILVGDHPQTVRQVFYQATVRGLVDKTEAGYKNSVVRLLLQMRLDGQLPHEWIADNTRWMRKPRTHSSLQDALELTARTYRRALWDHQPVYVEVWCEKDALAGVIMKETSTFDVPLMVTRGFSSETYLYEAACQIEAEDKPAYLYYFGDRDPSGIHIDRAIERGLRRLAPDAEIHFERVAVTEKQIVEMSLPTRPTKKSDSRSHNFDGDSVELDAIPAARLREIVNECITRHLDKKILYRTEIIERLERRTLDDIISNMRDADAAATQ